MQRFPGKELPTNAAFLPHCFLYSRELFRIFLLIVLSQTMVVQGACLDYRSGMLNGSCACGRIRY